MGGGNRKKVVVIVNRRSYHICNEKMGNMTPEKYLSKRGKEYIKVLVGILKERNLDQNEFSIELSLLANEYAKYEEAAEIIREEGYYVENLKTKWKQIAPQVNVQKDAMSNILKLSPKFGMTPLDHSKLPKREEKKVSAGSLLGEN